MIEISIIVPIYNAEQYVAACVQTVLAQTFTNFELLLIDDGSTDASLSIVKKLAEKDSRISVYTQENKGVSAARNRGLLNAKGKYITFVDADDTIAIDMYEVLHRTIIMYNVDVVNSRLSDEEMQSLKFDFVYDNSKMQEEIIPLLLNSDSINSVCTKLYSHKIIKENKLFFDENLTDGEDNLFNLMYFNYSQKVVFIAYQGYHYNIVVGSATNDSSKDYYSIILARYEQDYTRFLQMPVAKIQREKGKRFIKALVSSLFTYKASFYKKIHYISKVIKTVDFDKYLNVAFEEKNGFYYKTLFVTLKYKITVLVYFLIAYSNYKNKK